MANYDATPEWLKQHGLNGRDATRLVHALCALADHEGPIKDAIRRRAGGSDQDFANVCAALRYLVDGE